MPPKSAVLSVQTPAGVLIDTKTGQATFAFIKFLQDLTQVINATFSQQAAISANAIPTPTSTTRGGVLAKAAIAHEWVDSIDETGAPHLSQPGFSDLIGVATAQQVPPIAALSGNVTSSQVPQLSQLTGAVTAAQVPTLDQLNGQVTIGQLPTGLLGISITITTAKLTPLGSNGSMTFVAGILQSQVQAT